MKHGPYSLYQWANDFIWLICFSGVFVISLLTRTKRRMFLICASLLLILIRVVLESLGGYTVLLELLLLIVLGTYSIKYLLTPDKYLIQAD